MSIGTKSLLFGAHQFILHPLLVAFAWWKLYGFPWDPRLWVAFVVHDWGYWGLPNMDGAEGEVHPELGARIMGRLFDTPFERDTWQCPHPQCTDGILNGDAIDLYYGVADPCPICDRLEREATLWHDFTLFHSRHYSKLAGRKFSRLCIADKLVPSITPRWLYLTQVRLTGEYREYMVLWKRRETTEYGIKEPDAENVEEWHQKMSSHLYRWAWDNRERAA